MANYHFHLQQHEDGHREDVRYAPSRHAEPGYQQRAPALQFSQFAGHYESGYQRRVRPTQATHISAVAARPSRPRRQRQRSRSRSTPSYRSRSRRRRRTRRSRSTLSRSHRRRARSRSPSRRSRASRATRTTATEMSPSLNAAQPNNPQYPAKTTTSPGAVPAAVTPCHPRPRVIPPETSPFYASTLRVDGPTPPAPEQRTTSTTLPPPPPPSPFPPSPPTITSAGNQMLLTKSPPPPPAPAHPTPPLNTSVTRPAHPAKSPSSLQKTRTAPPPPPPPPTVTGPQSSNDSGSMTLQMLAHTVAMSSAGPISACDPQGVEAALAIRRARLTEATLNAMIQQDAKDNEFANFWQLPDLQLFKYYNGRLAYLAEETKTWTRVLRDEFTRFTRFFLRLVERPPPTAVFSWDIQPSVLVSFCQAIVTVRLPYEQIFTKPGKAWLHNNIIAWLHNNIIMWQIDADKFPGPASSALGTGQNAFRWWHGCNEASLLGIFKSGRVFRTKIFRYSVWILRPCCL